MPLQKILDTRAVRIRVAPRVYRYGEVGSVKSVLRAQLMPMASESIAKLTTCVENSVGSLKVYFGGHTAVAHVEQQIDCEKGLGTTWPNENMCLCTQWGCTRQPT
eukprot:m.69280 g.69280  ORF g.69280 m.69280 type:complete len:105 (-) comp16023_c0_seq8:870-1184(-)